MKYLVLAALFGCTQAIQQLKGTGMEDIKNPVARSSEEQHAQDKGQSLVQAGHGHSDEEEEEEDHHEVAKAIKVVNETGQSELSYYRSYDHDNFQGAVLNADAARMNVNVTKKSVGKYCDENDYVVAHWKKWSETDGTKMEDTKEVGDGRPAVFRVGHFQVSKCLDLAAQQMKSGEEATITCPHDLDQGGTVQNLYRNQYNGDYWLQDTTATKYKLSISECSLKPAYLEMHEDLETLSEGYPFYLLSGQHDSDGNPMALTVSPDDLYAPRVTGVHNVFLEKWGGKQHPNKYQQWIWNAEEQSLKSVGQEGGALFEGFNNNMIVFNWRGLHNQRFRYNIGFKSMQNRFTGNAMHVDGATVKYGQNIVTVEPKSEPGNVWIIDYQSEDHGHDHDHHD